MKILFLILILLSSTVFADTLKPVQLPDQFETKVSVDENIQWLIFSDDKEVSDKINQALDDLKITDVSKLKGAYVADISKMPSIVTTMFALPKMRKYAFKVLLDQDGAPTQSWPRQKGKASLLLLKKLEISEVKYADSTDDIKKFLQERTASQK